MRHVPSTGDVRFDEQVVVITGAGRNLGRQYALDLAARGARVVVNDLGIAISDTDGSGAAPARNPALDVVDEIVAAGGAAVANTDSVTTPEGGEAIVATALDTWGRIDALINNAGVVRQAPFADHTVDVYEPVIASQIGGHLNVTRPAWAAMAAQGGGRILHVSSGAGLFGIPGMAAYATAKMAVVGLTRALAMEGASPTTQVFAVEPAGWDDTGRSLASGQRETNPPGGSTLCDSLLAHSPGRLTFAVNQPRLAGGISVTDAEVMAAIRFAFTHLKVVVEPGGAVCLAALLAGKFDAKGRVVGAVLSGGNVDPDVFGRALAAS